LTTNLQPQELVVLFLLLAFVLFLLLAFISRTGVNGVSMRGTAPVRECSVSRLIFEYFSPQDQ